MTSSFSPSTLYETSVRKIASNFDAFSIVDLKRYLTDSMQFDIVWELYKRTSRRTQKSIQQFRQEIEKVDVFFTLLSKGERRTELHIMFHEYNDLKETNHNDITFNDNNNNNNLIDSLVSQTLRLLDTSSTCQMSRLVANSYNFACFLIDAGWYVGAEQILRQIESLSGLGDVFVIELRMKLLHVLSSYAKFSEADVVFHQLMDSLGPLTPTLDEDFTVNRCRQRLRSVSTCSSSYMMTDEDESEGSSQESGGTSFDNPANLSAVFCEFSNYFFVRSQYQDAFHWSIQAVKLLHNGLSPKIIVDVLRQGSKACVVRRQFTKAEILIQEAVLLAKETYGEEHPKYADCLVDFGFYLLNVDGVAKSVQSYKTALKIRENLFGPKNLLVAMGNEELAYALYVHEYSTGQFDEAKDHAERSLNIIQDLCPNNHLFHACPRRVLALIIEEIAIDSIDKEESQSLLKHAESLHNRALALAITAFGEMNIQTAKHYGNIGRLYQTMEKYTEAEVMHLKSISIKESIVGKFDYEVALSIGHLASLYNYDLSEFEKAEKLYLRSIEIALKLFGPSYSGLEYDYRGLVRIYQETGKWSQFLSYQYKLGNWKTLRDERKAQGSESHVLLQADALKPIHQIVNEVISDSDIEPRDLETQAEKEGLRLANSELRFRDMES